MPTAVCSRLLHFEAGPQRHRFYACEEHRPQLENGQVGCFFGRLSEPVIEEDPDDESACDLCREVEGP